MNQNKELSETVRNLEEDLRTIAGRLEHQHDAKFDQLHRLLE
jgi:hypothetical protein